MLLKYIKGLFGSVSVNETYKAIMVNGKLYTNKIISEEELKPFYKDKCLHLPFVENLTKYIISCHPEYTTNLWEDARKLDLKTIDYLTISEPLVSFVNTVKENPRRFKVTCVDNLWGPVYSIPDGYIITDKLLNRQFEILVRVNMVKGLPFKPSEVNWAFSQICDIFRERRERLHKIKNERKLKRVMDMYYVPNSIYEEK